MVSKNMTMKETVLEEKPHNWRMRRGIKKFWGYISHGDSTWGTLNMILPALWATVGGIISYITSANPLAWFVAISGGIAFGLLVSNEIVARAIKKRYIELSQELSQRQSSITDIQKTSDD